MIRSHPVPDLGTYLFAIAVIADTHLNEQEDRTSSPYETNRVANARTRWVIERLNQLRPEVVIHLGDLVHPVPMLPTFETTVRNFKEITSTLERPLYLVPGNHDVGDKPVVWAPAATVNDASLALWQQHFGEDYYSFDLRGLHVVVVNAQILNSGLATEAAQRQWLEGDLAAHAGRRTFLCLHYPPFVSEPDEPETYDNLAEPGRSWLLDLVARYRPEAMFCGHVHNFWFNRYEGTECYILPSTAFVRQDYSELARVEAGAEGGRNDLPKLGFFLVKIYERGHVCHVIRSHGATLGPGEVMPRPARVEPRHTKENARAPLGVDLRHPWAEVVDIPPMGALDEFARKRARNDYPLMVLWEMGIRRLRVPLPDLVDPRVRERMQALRSLGHAFTVYTLGVPQGLARDVLVEHHDLVDAWEVVCSWAEVEPTMAAIQEVKEKAPLTVLLSKLRLKEDVKREGSRYYHVVNHGFVTGERGELEECLRSGRGASVIDGFVFRVGRQASPWKEIGAVGEIAGALSRRAAVHVRMASANPAEACTDDRANANRVAEALVAAMVLSGSERAPVDVFLDTFADIDCGYFLRTGLVDRRYNPRLAAHVVRNLYAVLNAGPDSLTPGALHEGPSGRICTIRRASELLALVLPEPGLGTERIPCGEWPAVANGTAERIDLETGHVIEARWRRVGAAIDLLGTPVVAGPSLVRFDGRPA